ncbi:hypothetical protein [Paenibacillus dakarensis]|nr:hypothetical protein [Paenibacillus dakarensis]
MSDAHWFIPLCIAVSVLFTISILFLTISTLRFRSQVNKKYDRGKFNA